MVVLQVRSSTYLLYVAAIICYLDTKFSRVSTVAVIRPRPATALTGSSKAQYLLQVCAFATVQDVKLLTFCKLFREKMLLDQKKSL